MASKKSGRKLDLPALFADIERRARSRNPVPNALRAVADACVEQGAPVNLSKLAGLPIAAELRRLEAWFATLWSPKPPPARHRAIYFGIVEFEDGRYDVRVSAVPGKRPDTEDWQFERALSPKPEFAGSDVLAALSSSQLTENREARHLLCLAYVALVAARLCSKLVEVIARDAVVVAGYEEGDFVTLGTLEHDGTFRVSKPEPEARATKLPKGELFQVVDVRGKDGTWLLNSPKSPSGRYLPVEFGRTGKRIKPERYVMTVYKKGKPADIAFTHSRLMIASARIGEIVSKVVASANQRVPVDIEGAPEPYEIINILNMVPSRRLLDWSKKHGKPVSEASLGESHIALTGPSEAVVVVSRRLAEALAAANPTGTELVPLDKSKL